jgi:hypothetical protein
MIQHLGKICELLTALPLKTAPVLYEINLATLDKFSLWNTILTIMKNEEGK